VAGRDQVTGTSELCLAWKFWPQYRLYGLSDRLEEVPLTFAA
jgi:hypothetical protein